MPKGSLIVRVYADNIAQPVYGAKVKVYMKNNQEIELMTDRDGGTDRVELEAPSREYSLTPQEDVRPYSTYTLYVSRMGLVPLFVEGVEILDGQTTIQPVFLSTKSYRYTPEDKLVIGDNTLWGMYPAHVPQKNYVNNSFNKGDVLPTPIIPEFIIVHDGLPTDSSADNHYVLYTDYIKNVASHEVYSTWPEESLKANIYCILSYTMNRIYTEWYPSNGYDFTITSSTQFDHKYVHGGTVYESISLLVDEIFMNYIKLKDSISPFLAQYNDGIKINHVGWLSQWGSKDLAEKGYSAEDIIKHYYGDGVGLVTADLIAGMPNSFPGYNLTMNIKSKAVQQIQIELNTISSSYPIIPKIPPTNGIYEQSTRNSVEVFQKQFSLPVTGVVDFTTWYKISLIFIGVTKALEGVFKLS